MAETSENVSTKLFDYLKAEGVTHVFGIPGGALAHLLNEFYDRPDEMTYVVTRHEAGAAYMADGYFRATGRLGVSAVTSGPGATNTISGACNAQSAGSRTLVLTGEVSEAFFGKGFLQEGADGPLDLNQVFKSAVGYSAVISSPQNAQTLFETALRTAGSIPHQTCHLSLPLDVCGQPSTMTVPDSPSAYTPRPAGPAPDNVTEVLDILAKAKRPMILIGDGCRIPLRDADRLAALEEMVTEWGIPVMTTADGKGVFDEEHALSLRAFGIANCVWPHYWMTQKEPAYDALLIIGSGLGQLATNVWNTMLMPDGPIIQIDANPHVIGRGYPTQLGIESEAGLWIDAMAAGAKARPVPAEAKTRRQIMAQIKQDHSPFDNLGEYQSESALIQPAALCRVMQETLHREGEDTLIFLDAGNCVGWGVHYLVSGPGFEVHPSLDMGPMGFGVCAVIGAKIARPDTVVATLTGDGAFLMQGAEVSTAAANKVGAIWIILDDNDLAMVSQGMTHFYGRDLARWKQLYALGNPDLVAFSEGLGAEAVKVTTPAEARAALIRAVERGAEGIPQVIVAKINPDAEPPYYNPLYASEHKGGL